MILNNWLQSKSTQPEPSANKVGVLFVCMANFCRSPMARGIFQQLVIKQDLGHAIFVDAAGTHGHFAGAHPDPRARSCCRQRGIYINHYRARQVQSYDFLSFDYLIAMDRSNYKFLKELAPPQQMGKIRLFLELAPQLGRQDVPDPYYGSLNDFEQVLTLMEEAANSLLQEICQQHLYPRNLGAS